MKKLRNSLSLFLLRIYGNIWLLFEIKPKHEIPIWFYPIRYFFFVIIMLVGNKKEE